MSETPEVLERMLAMWNERDPFLKEHIWYGDGGIRKKLWRGGELEAKQRLGFQNLPGVTSTPRSSALSRTP